jgi:hypothetical protein
VFSDGIVTDINKFGQLMRNLGQLLAPADLQKMMGGMSKPWIPWVQSLL